MAEPQLTPDEFNSVVSAVTNAFGDPTRREIYLFARDAGDAGVTAGAVAEHFELHPNVARHHLEKLTGGGYLIVEVARPAADGTARAAGRPSKHYRAGPLDATLALPLKHDDLLAGLLARALDALGPSEAERLADDVGFEYGVQLAQRIDPTESHRSVKAALATVADALTAHGFAAHTESHDGQLTIVSECCPFGEHRHRVPARGVRARPRHDPGHARRPLRRDHAGVRDQPSRRRRPLRRARLSPLVA